MVRYLFDFVLSVVGLVMLTPLFSIVAVGIWITSPGPIFYRARRVGISRRIFTMYKFRTMHSDQSSLSSVISARNDPRVFPFGLVLRRYKIDELPQLFNVVRGEMSLVGPRAEDPRIVYDYYAPAHFETLQMLPGIASPGSIYNYTHGEELLDTDDPEKHYREKVLPIKLALDTVYVREASLTYNIKIIFRAFWVVISKHFGKRHFPDPPEMQKSRALIHPTKTE